VLLALALRAPSLAAQPGEPADPGCGETVVDDAGVLGPGREAVLAAAGALGRRGADVHVRVVAHVDQPSLDAYQTTLEPRCPSWRSADGSRADSLISVIVAVEDGKTGIYYGHRWDPFLDSVWVSVQSDEMNPRFARGDFAGGLVAGLRALESALAQPPQLQPPDVVAGPVARAPHLPRSTAASRRGATADLDTLVLVLMASVAAAATFGLLRGLAGQLGRPGDGEATEYGGPA
jgi:uncharacterized membrane protein YgcG